MLAGIGFILVVVPTVNAAAKKAPKFGVFQIVNLPSLLPSSAFPAFCSIVDPGFAAATPAQGPNTIKVRPTDDIQIPKPGSGD